MNSSKKVLGLLAASIISSQGVVVWTGATSADPFDDTNWDFSGSAVTAVDSNVSVQDNLTVTNGNVLIPNLGGQVRLQIGNGFTMTLDNSILGLVGGGNDGVGGEPGGTGVSVNLTNNSQFNPFFIVNAVDLDIDATSSATFGGGGVPINLSTVNLTDGAVLAQETIELLAISAFALIRRFHEGEKFDGFLSGNRRFSGLKEFDHLGD